MNAWRDTVNELVDILGCTREQARLIINAALREGYNLPIEVQA